MLKPLLTRLARGGEIAIFLGGRIRRPDRVNLNPHLTSFIRQFTWRHSNELSWVVFPVNGYLQRLAGELLFWVTDRSLDDFIKTRLRWVPVGIVASLILMPAIVFLNIFSVDQLMLRLSSYRGAALLCCRRPDDMMENYVCGEKPTT
jgi:hypothetical protein